VKVFKLCKERAALRKREPAEGGPRLYLQELGINERIKTVINKRQHE
jgi:hypothetical protein